MPLVDWIDQPSALQILGKSASTLDRLTNDGTIESRLEERPGRKPERMYSAGSIEAVASGARRAAPTNGAALTVSRPAIAPAIDQTAAARFELEQRRDRREELAGAFWLTLDEAAEYIRLPRATLLKAIQEKKLKAIKAGAWRIRRTVLEAFGG